MLEGGVPYVDFVDTNPPAAFLIHLLPVLVSDHLELDLTLVFHAISAGLAIYSAFSVFYVLGFLSMGMSYLSRLARASVLVSFAAYVAAFGWLGERDYLFVITYIPFLYIRLCRHTDKEPGKLIAMVSGVLCGPFLLLKPHFWFVAAGVETFLWYRSRRFRALASSEVLAVIIWLGFYAAFFAFGSREMNEAFFNRWLPFIAKYYAGHEGDLLQIALRSIPFFPFFCFFALGLSIISLLAARRIEAHGRLQMEALAVGTLLTYAMFLAQGKGWFYQLFPTIGFFALLSVDFCDRVFEVYRRGKCIALPSRQIIVLTLICLGLTLGNVVLAGHRMGKRNTVNAYREPFIAIVKSHTSRADRVLFLSYSLDPGCPVIVQTDRRPGSRYFPHLWPIQYLYLRGKASWNSSTREDTLQSPNPEERMMLNELGSDVMKLKPKLIFVDTSKPAGSVPSVRDYLLHNGWQGDFMAQYRLLATIEKFEVYLLDASKR